MTLMTRTRLDIVPLTKHIGAEIRGFDLRQKPDGDTIKAISHVPARYREQLMSAANELAARVPACPPPPQKHEDHGRGHDHGKHKKHEEGD